MNQDDKVEIVQAMQDYIKKNITETNFSLEAMYEHIGYSQRHANRLFCELLHMTPNEYVRRTMLTSSTKKLLKTEKNIIDVALDSNYETHEGYTRAFKKAFRSVPPSIGNHRELSLCSSSIPYGHIIPILIIRRDWKWIRTLWFAQSHRLKNQKEG